ncbi:MAG TPA: histidine phosphatase family protein [Candidatus Saccharimonadales bacterium]|nr:histidine phosphatase family protein [Candidatus Saccharimonadales bacterium]
MEIPDTEVYLIRHAESEFNVRPQFVNGRSNDTELTWEGKTQARVLGEFLLANDVMPDSVYTSPARRTRDTATLCLKGMGLLAVPIADSRLQELDQGQWTGQPRDEVYTPKVTAQLKREGKDFKAPGGESMNEVAKRMRAWLETSFTDVSTGVTERHFAFTHGVAIRCLVGSFRGWSQDKIYKTRTPNTSVTLLTRQNGLWRPDYVGFDPQSGKPLPSGRRTAKSLL